MVALQRKTGFYQASTSELFGKVWNFRNGRRRHSTHILHMRQQSSMPIGLG